MENGEQLTFEFEQRPTIKGFPELRWTGKRPYRSTQYYPAQLRETYGKEQNGWINKIFWGDNLQVMSHLLKEYRGQIDLIYIDPPFDSKADYKKKIEIKGVGKAVSDSSSFEEKQYGDIWTNDEYLQFMYERILLLRELLSDTGSIFLHCDDSRNFYLRCLLSEVFGEDNFHNEIIWKRSTATGLASKRCGTLHDTIYWYSKTDQYYFEMQYHEYEEDYLKRARKDENGRMYMQEARSLTLMFWKMPLTPHQLFLCADSHLYDLLGHDQLTADRDLFLFPCRMPFPYLRADPHWPLPPAAPAFPHGSAGTRYMSFSFPLGAGRIRLVAP